MNIVKKPWGNEKVFTINEISSVKILNVNKNSALSLQKHKKRKELWYFLSDGWVQLGERKFKVKEGKVVVINKNTFHRLYSKNKAVKVLEVSFGKFDENDIIRVEDKYGRVK